MRIKFKISILSIALMLVLLIPMISIIGVNTEKNNSINQNNDDQLIRPKTSDDTSSPIISDVQVSDAELELRDMQTITCNVSDDSEIDFVYAIIWFESDPITREMNNIEGNIYQAIWSSVGAELGTYFVDIRAEDEWGNADTIENVVSFTVILKPNIYVASINSEHATLPSLSDQLNYDDESSLTITQKTYNNDDNQVFTENFARTTYKDQETTAFGWGNGEVILPLKPPTLEDNYWESLGYFRELDVINNYAYVLGNRGFSIFDISDPSNIIKTGFRDARSSYRDIKINDHMQYVPAHADNYVYGSGGHYAHFAITAEGEFGFSYYDISNPAFPELAWKGSSHRDTPGIVWAVDIIQHDWNTPGSHANCSYAFIADGSAGLKVYWLRVGGINPSILASCDTPGEARDVKVRGNYAYVADYNSLQIIDVSGRESTNTFDAFVVGSWNIPSSSPSAESIVISGNYAYIGNFLDGMLYVIDISNPTNPYLVSSLYVTGVKDLYVSNNILYISRLNVGMAMVDISDPINPRIIYSENLDFSIVEDICVSGNYMYVVDYSRGISIYSISDNIEYDTSSTAISKKIPIDGDVKTAMLLADDDIRDNTEIEYYLSADGGYHWEKVIKGKPHTFTYPGNKVKWKAILSTNDPTMAPSIKSITIQKNDALYCTPDLPWYYSTRFGSNGVSALERYDPGWSASRGDSKILTLSCEEWDDHSLFVKHRPMFYVRNYLCPDETPEDIEISISIVKMWARCLPSFSISIYNYGQAKWYTLYSRSSPDNPNRVTWFNNEQFTFNKIDLFKFDNNLNHFVNNDGYIQLEIQAKSSFWIDFRRYNWIFPEFSPHAYVGFITDQVNVKAIYRPESTNTFNFVDENGINLLNGIDDYYLYFKGETINGNAQFNNNDKKLFDISSDGTIINDPIPIKIFDATDMSITGRFENINIDYLYLKKMRDHPQIYVESVEGTDEVLTDQLKYDDGELYGSTYSVNSNIFDSCTPSIVSSSLDSLYIDGTPANGMVEKNDGEFYCLDAYSIQDFLYLYQEFTFDISSELTGNKFISDITLDLKVEWSRGDDVPLSGAPEEYPWSRLDILNKITEQWDILIVNPLIDNDWTDDSIMLKNFESVDEFNTFKDKYISDTGQIKLNIIEYTWGKDEEWGGWFYIPDPEHHLKWDYINLKIGHVYFLNELEFIFEPGILNGAHDFYLWIQARTNIGEAQFYMNDFYQFTIGVTWLTIGPVLKLEIHDVTSIKIVLIDADISIDYLYLERK